MKHHTHVSVPEMMQLLEKNNVSVNKTSVYRALERLVDQRMVCKRHQDSGEALFELFSKHGHDEHHVHLRCIECGETTEAACTYEHPTEIDGFEVDHHHVTLVGTCKDCQD